MSSKPTKEIMVWADDAMFEAQPMLQITPKVSILAATADPLGTCAADMRMYRGDPVYDMKEITDEERRWAWEELSKTALNTPFEGVNIKFMIEGVTRSFTHQMVRQRVGAYYVQESLRFAVKRGLAKETALPPSIAAPPEGLQGEPAWEIWNKTVNSIAEAYNQLVDAGIPAEDARGLLPHAVTTRIIYHTNLRALFEHAGNRLCTQAQFEWRKVFTGIMLAMQKHAGLYLNSKHDVVNDQWQWEIITEPKSYTFTPICYRMGKCAFKSGLDRGCSIRDRVDQGKFYDIEPMEWLANPTAGMTGEQWGQMRPAQ